GGLRRLFSRRFGLQAADLVLEQVNSLGKLAGGKQRLVLTYFVGDFFLRTIVFRVDRGHFVPPSLMIPSNGRGCHTCVSSALRLPRTPSATLSTCANDSTA